MSNKESQTGKFFMTNRSGLLTPENELERQFEQAKLEKEIEEANRLFLEVEKAKQAEIEAKLETLELVPTFNKVILLPYPRNPYRKIMHNGLIVEYTGDFLNPDSGEKDTLKELVACAKVVEVGPDVLYLCSGDDVFYDPRTCYPVPFFKSGYLVTNEQQILCVLNENLKRRFINIKSK